MICPKCGNNMSSMHCECGFDIISKGICIIGKRADEIVFENYLKAEIRRTNEENPEKLKSEEKEAGQKTKLDEEGLLLQHGERLEALRSVYENRILQMSERINLEWPKAHIHEIGRWSKPPKDMKRISFGNYYVDTTKNKSPVSWLILEENRNSLFLLSEKVLDLGIGGELNDWEDSLTRRILNERFLNEAFSEEERSKILYTYHDNAAMITTSQSESESFLTELNKQVDKAFRDKVFYSRYEYYKMHNIQETFEIQPDSLYSEFSCERKGYHKGRSGIENCVCDRLFLLSSLEVEYYFPRPSTRVAKGTKYLGEKHGSEYGPSTKHYNWYLRNKGDRKDGYNGSKNQAVGFLGHFYTQSGIVGGRTWPTWPGLRPALWIIK